MGEEETELIPLTLECCDSCHRLGHEASALTNDKDLMWLCIGEIIKPENPINLHEKFNEVRLCILRETGLDDIISYDWTPYEVSRISVALTHAISNYLIKDQPTLEEVDELKSEILTNNELEKVKPYKRRRKGGKRKSVEVKGYTRRRKSPTTETKQ